MLTLHVWFGIITELSTRRQATKQKTKASSKLWKIVLDKLKIVCYNWKASFARKLLDNKQNQNFSKNFKKVLDKLRWVCYNSKALFAKAQKWVTERLQKKSKNLKKVVDKISQICYNKVPLRKERNKYWTLKIKQRQTIKEPEILSTF